MPSKRSRGQGSGEGFAKRASDRFFIPVVKGRKGRKEIRPPKPVRNAIVILRGINGISQTIYFTNPNPRGQSFKSPKILTAAELEEERALLRQIVGSDEEMEKNDEKAPEK